MTTEKEDKKEVICKVCGKAQKFMTQAHLVTHNITREQYDMMPDYIPENITESTDEFSEMSDEEIKVTPAEMTKRIFGEQERDINRPLKDFLNEFGVTEVELRELVRKYTTGRKIDPKIEAENNIKIGMKGAELLKDLDNPTTTSLHVAEILSTKYGFTVTDVRSAKGNVPKTWVLQKN